MKYFSSSIALGIAISFQAQAGETVLYEEPGQWVIEAEIEDFLEDRETLILYDRQVKLEDGVVERFTDLAYDISTTQAMQQFGTLQFPWLPDKGDLILHRLDILRDGEVIDLLSEGVRPEVIRRERQLEQRSVDGMLTAVISVPRLQVGDVLRVSATTTLRDQALDDHMQATEGFIAKPGRVNFGRLRLLWPEGSDVQWRTLGQVEEPEVELVDGHQVIEFEMPIAEPKKMPDDAPGRFTVKPLVQAGSFASWNAVSQSMAPHFVTEGTIKPGGPLADEVDRIQEATQDPLQRTALALQLVQDEISYLANGLDGGNYLPQMPEETWQLRYGDCKAKSLLLLAMLREMGIEAETVLVHSSQGDVVSISQPLPGAFDHMIVRAHINGLDYWLDGTSSGTRLDTMHEVPNFGWALPLVAEGSDLVHLEQRWPKVPDRLFRITYDMTNGVDFPTIYDIEIEARGVAGARFRQLADETDKRTILGNAMSYFRELMEGMTYEANYFYDEDTGVGRLVAKGMTFDDFAHDRGISTFKVNGTSTGWQFSTDRARSLWRDIPYRIDGPYYEMERSTFLLPEPNDKVELTGTETLDEFAAGMRFSREIVLDGKKVQLEDSIAYIPAEILPSDIPSERTKIARISSGDPDIRIHGAQRSWELSDSEIAARVEPYVAAAENLLVAVDDPAPIYKLRGSFLQFGRRYQEALAEFDRVIDTTATAEAYSQRANLHYVLGDIEKAQADAQAAYDLQGDLATATNLANYMARNGQANEGLDLLDGLGLTGDEAVDLDIMWSEYSGLAGRQDEAWDRLLLRKDERPDQSAIFNTLCWHAGIWANNVEEAEAYCQRAVDMSGQSAATVDSRALVYYRLGRTEEALADLEMALEKAPGQAASMYLRGLIRMEEGDRKAGQTDLLHARRIDPRIDDRYAEFGLVPS